MDLPLIGVKKIAPIRHTAATLELDRTLGPLRWRSSPPMLGGIRNNPDPVAHLVGDAGLARRD